MILRRSTWRVSAGRRSNEGPERSRSGSRSMALVGALAAVAAVFVAAAGSTSNIKPYTANFHPGPVSAGASNVLVNLVLENQSSQQTLGSADVTAAKQGTTSFTITGPTTLSGGGTVDTSGLPGVLRLRSLGIAPGQSRTIPITVNTPCLTGPYTWEIRAKQSNNFSGPPGNDFTNVGGNLVTTVDGGCKLEWVTQPATTTKDTRITGAPFDANAARVAVRAVDGDGNPISASGTATLAKVAGTFTSTGDFTGTTASFDQNGLATFGDLMSTATGSGFRLQASADGFLPTPASSPAFGITLSGQACVGSGCPTFSTTLGGNSSVDAGATGGSFTFLGIGPASIPSSVTSAGGGCAYYTPAGNAFEAFDGRTNDQGTLQFTYYLAKKDIEKLYGNSSGQQFVPLCAGAAWVDDQGAVRTCTDANAPDPWKGKRLNTEGKFDGTTRDAFCDEGTGLFWGILGSFQDYTNSNPAYVIDPTVNPTVTGWGSTTSSRYFTISVPAPWDWKMG